MLDRDAFEEIPSILDVGKRRLPIIVTGRPVCWKCGKPDHMASACPGKPTSDHQSEAVKSAPGSTDAPKSSGPSAPLPTVGEGD